MNSLGARRIGPWGRCGRYALTVLFLILAPASAGGQSLQVSGDATWTLSAGFGDPEGLEGSEYSLGSPELTQRLRLRLSGEVVAGVAVEANLDNFQSDNLQLLSLTFTRGDWTARFGDFRYQPQNPSVAQALSLKGVEAEGPLGPVTLGLTFARAQGIPAVKEFTGQSGSDMIRFVPGGPYAPTRAGGHLEASLDGASFFDLGAVSFDPDFVDAFIVWRDAEDSEGRDLAEVLTANDLGELVTPAGSGDPILVSGTAVLLGPSAYLPPPPASNLLILAREPRQILRDQLQELIRLYNLQNQLQGDERLAYPYSPGTASDAAFLDELFRYNTAVGVGAGAPPEDPQPLHQGRTRRYYDLGHRQLDPESVKVTVVRAGQAMDPRDLTELQDLTLQYDEGILDLGPLGAAVIDELEAIEVTYRYRVESNIYTLGLSLAVDSERVFLNGRPLQRYVDYTIDYEAGILILLVAVGPEDRLRVEYESFRGGLGGGGTYQRNIYGGRVGFELLPGWTLGLDLVQGADLTPPPEEAASLGVMPNTHTVAGVRSRFTSELWEADLQLARSEDRFPFDDNRKPHQPNQVSALAGGTALSAAFLIAGHQNGLSVWLPEEAGDPDDASSWHSYGLGQGPAGVPVHDVAVSEADGWWFLATGGGLTAVNVTGDDLASELDSAGRWHRYYKSDGLPSSDVRAVAVDDTTATLWVGTTLGLVSAPLSAFAPGGDPIPWETHDSRVGPEITALATGTDGRLYVAGEQGLARQEGRSFEILKSGERLEAIAVPEDPSSSPVYTGGPEGLYYLPSGGTSPLPVNGLSGIRDLTFWSGKLWVASASGLWVVEEPAVPSDVAAAGLTEPLASLGVGPPPGDTADALWIGAGPLEGQPAALWILSEPTACPAPVPFDDEIIPPEDAYRYHDLPAGEHTAGGWKGSLDLTRRFDWGQVYLSALRQEADFLPVGATQRQEVFAWEAGGRWDASERLSFRLSHRQEDRTSLPRRDSESDASPPPSPYRLWTDRLALTWQIGPELELAYQTARRDELDTPGEESQEDRYSATVRERFFEDRLTVGMGLEQVVFRHWIDPIQGYRAQNLLGELDGRIGEGFTLRIRYRRPLRVEEAEQTPSRLSESVSYGVGWDGDLGPVQVKLAYDDDRTEDRFPETRSARTQRASSRAEIPSVEAGPLDLAPSLFASWREITGWHLSHQVRAEAGGGLDVGWSSLKLGSTLSGIRTEYLETGKQNDELRYSLTARWEGWQQLTPSLEWRRTDGIASLPGASPQTSTQGQTRASLQWRPREGLASTTSVTYTDRSERNSDTYRFTLANRVSYALTASTSTAALVELSQGTASSTSTLTSLAPPLHRQVRTELSASHRFSASWSAEAVTGAVWGEKDENPFTSYYARLSARLTF